MSADAHVVLRNDPVMLNHVGTCCKPRRIMPFRPRKTSFITVPTCTIPTPHVSTATPKQDDPYSAVSHSYFPRYPDPSHPRYSFSSMHPRYAHVTNDYFATQATARSETAQGI